jgi:hypothetical protein
MLTFQDGCQRQEPKVVQFKPLDYNGSGIGYVVWNLFFNSIQIRHL